MNRIIKSPIDAGLVFLLGSEGIHWVSEDCGQSVRSLGKGKNLREFLFHPTERTWILASGWTNCYSKEKQTSNCQITKELYFSRDLGKNWALLSNYIVQFAWGFKGPETSDGVPKERIILSQELNSKPLSTPEQANTA